MQKKSSIPTISSLFLSCILALLSFNSLALELLPFASVKVDLDTPLEQQQIIAHPSSPNQFYLLHPDGEVLELSNGNIVDKPFFELAKALNNNEVELTALAFHPNFSLKDQPGYQTIYTAHIEHYNAEVKSARLPKVIPENTSHDLVLNEWHVLSNKKNVDPDSKREILRIASTSIENRIQQLTFNPYVDKWHDSFGLLHIVLNANANLASNPLYSGAILRIHPNKFGLRSYTIPKSNPFLENKAINDELVLLGAGNIKKIIWQKKRTTEWFIFQQDGQSTQLVKGIFSNDLRKNSSPAIWQSKLPNAIRQIAWYQGRQISDHVYEFIYLAKLNEQWQLNSLSISNTQQLDMHSPLPSLMADAKPILSTDSNNELIIIDTVSGLFNRLIVPKSANTKSTETVTATPEVANSSTINTNMIIALIALLGVVVAGVFIIRFIIFKTNPLVRLKKHYARINFSEINGNIQLFAWRKNQMSVELPIEQISQSTVLLNGEVVNIISHHEETRFDQTVEKEMLKLFMMEKRLKMVDKRSRTIELYLTDINKHTYEICIYTRTGNQRYTKLHYDDCVNQVIKWCKLIDKTIHKTSTVNAE